MTFVFYDTETTGSNAWYDQILQFAAIKTDDDLNELERFEIRTRLLPHVVPTPGALVVTGMTIDQLMDASLPSHYEMVRAIRQKLLSWSPAVFMGYNSLEFDEMLLRQALYQTLHSPYLTNTNGNSRADLLQIAMAIKEFEPGILNWAMRPDGKPSFRLDQLAPANGFEHKHAHEALADVEATIHIARIVRSKARELWDHAIMLGSKAAAVNYALAEPLRLYTEFHYIRPHHWLVSPLAVDPNYMGHVVSYDLAVAPDEILNLNEEAFLKRLTASPKPLRVIKANACPTIQSWNRGDGLVDTYKLGETELHRRAHIIQTERGLQNRLMKAHALAKSEFEPSPYLEGQIYDGFPSFADQQAMEDFHKTDWPTRAVLASAFEDRRLRQLARRLIYLEHSDVLDAAMRTEFGQAIGKRLLATEKVPWVTLPKAIDDTDAMIEEANQADTERLCRLRDYLVSKMEASKMASLPGPSPSLMMRQLDSNR